MLAPSAYTYTVTHLMSTISLWCKHHIHCPPYMRRNWSNSPKSLSWVWNPESITSKQFFYIMFSQPSPSGLGTVSLFFRIKITTVKWILYNIIWYKLLLYVFKLQCITYFYLLCTFERLWTIENFEKWRQSYLPFCSMTFTLKW